MSIDIIKSQFTEAGTVLEKFIASEDNFKKIQSAGSIILAALLSDHKVISCGNGGSMCDAMHFAEEFTGRFRDDRRSLPAIAISDPAYLTCTANDYGFEYVYSRFIEGMGQPKDVLLAISTSGNSPNIINAAKAARKKGMMVVGLTGKSGGNLAEHCDVEIRAPETRYADRVQEIHIKVIHSLIHFVEINL